MEQTLARVFIAEDEQPAMDLLIDYISGRNDLTLAGIAANGREALQKLSRGGVDLLFLDIDLPVLSGIEVLERLPAAPRVVFTTAYDRYAIRAFELGAADYLLKPITRDRFMQAVDRALSAPGGSLELRRIGLSFRDGGTHRIVPHGDIVYLSSSGRSTVIHTNERSYEAHSLMKHIESRLPAATFMRVHKQFIVNLTHISHFKYYIGGQYTLYLNDEEHTTLTVGQKFAPALRERLGV